MNFTSGIPMFLKNCSIVPIRWARLRSRSATRPSHWWNSARWVRSTLSFLNTRSMEK